MEEKFTTKDGREMTVDEMIREHQYGTTSKTQVFFAHVFGGILTVAAIGLVFKIISWVF